MTDLADDRKQITIHASHAVSTVFVFQTRPNPPLYTALLYSLFCYHKVDICPWFGYNHSVVDIGFNYNLYMWYAWTACSTDVLCICYHSWYPDSLCRHLIPPSACIKQLFLTVCHKNYHSYT